MYSAFKTHLWVWAPHLHPQTPPLCPFTTPTSWSSLLEAKHQVTLSRLSMFGVHTRLFAERTLGVELRETSIYQHPLAVMGWERDWTLTLSSSWQSPDVRRPFSTRPNFKELLSTKIAWHEISSLIKTGLPTKHPSVANCLLLVFSCCLLILKSRRNLVLILFLSR